MSLGAVLKHGGELLPIFEGEPARSPRNRRGCKAADSSTLIARYPPVDRSSIDVELLGYHARAQTLIEELDSFESALLQLFGISVRSQFISPNQG